MDTAEWLNANSLSRFPFVDDADMRYGATTHAGTLDDCVVLDIMLSDFTGCHGSLVLKSVSSSSLVFSYSAGQRSHDIAVALPQSGIAEGGTQVVYRGAAVAFLKYVVGSQAGLPQYPVEFRNRPRVLPSRIVPLSIAGLSGLRTKYGSSAPGRITLGDGYNTTLSILNGKIRLNVGYGLGLGPSDGECVSIPAGKIGDYVDIARLTAKVQATLADLEGIVELENGENFDLVFHSNASLDSMYIDIAYGGTRSEIGTARPDILNTEWGLLMYRPEPTSLSTGDVSISGIVYRGSSTSVGTDLVEFQSICDMADERFVSLNGASADANGNVTISGGNGITVVPDKRRHAIVVEIGRTDI